MFFNLKKHFKKDQYKTSHTTSITLESGRTMTEMLGTLAIVGVLSIGGIAGYSYAMDKYRANTTINDINLRAIDLITQSGRELPLSLSEWSRTSAMGYTFSDPEWADDGSIALEISGLPERVCEMVVDTLGERFDIEVGATRYTGDNSICGDDNAVTVFFEKTGAGITCNPACGDGEVCDKGICVDEETQPGTSGPFCTLDDQCPECRLCNGRECSSNQPNGTSCTGGTCSNGECVAGECSSNSDCAADFFCADTNESCESAHPSICQKMNFTRRTITLNDTSEVWYMSSGGMTWWDAQSACERLGKTMVTVDELVSDWSSPSTGGFTPTDRAQKLYDAFDSGAVWTSDDNGSCDAFYVGLSSGNVRNYNRVGYILLALCH
ncbi:MAG: type II secretion system protein [Alphaproteobacteria bacterium]